MFFAMRYFTEKPALYSTMYGEIYSCNHPLYDRCTLYREKQKGLAVVQQRFEERTKSTYWTEIDPWLTDTLYLTKGFMDYFESMAAEPEHGLYPTVTVRQIMWKLRLKPLKRQRWETVMDRKFL